MHKFLFHNRFIVFLYLFRALLCSSSGGQNCIIQHLVSSHSVGGRPVRRLRTGRLHQIHPSVSLSSWINSNPTRRKSLKFYAENGGFQASAAVQNWSALLWDFMQCRLVAFYPRYGQPIRHIFEVQALKFLYFLNLDCWTYRLSREIRNKLPIYTAQNLRRQQISYTKNP